jgi:propanol-preferring alcohol dehydrogenase
VCAEVPEPVAGPREVVLEVRAAGLCHTDVGILHDPTWGERVGPLPLVLGHEVAGVVHQVGPDVESCAVGDRVGVNPNGTTRPGIGRDGGYAPLCLARPDDLVQLPGGLCFKQAAIGTDAGLTAYHAVMTTGGVSAGQRVGIIGLGGLGQVGVRVAVLAGAEVYLAEVKQEAFPLARQLGATDVAADVSAFTDRELDVIVDFAGFGTTTSAAVATVRPEGRVVQVGMGRLEALVSTWELILRRVTLVGSRGGTGPELAEVYRLMADGNLAPELTTLPFGRIPDGLEQLHRGAVTGRLVAVPG